jgi:hypothetical protein
MEARLLENSMMAGASPFKVFHNYGAHYLLHLMFRQVRVTLRLAIGQSVCLGVEPHDHIFVNY